MAVKIIKGCLLDAYDRREVQCIAHVCNAQGVMGSGIAKSIKDRYPEAFLEYKKKHSIGTVTLSEEDFPIFNMVAQEFYGRGKRQLNYGAMAKCLTEVAQYTRSTETIGFPYLMGCDRAGGDWEIVLEMIEFIFKDFEVNIYKLN